MSQEEWNKVGDWLVNHISPDNSDAEDFLADLFLVTMFIALCFLVLDFINIWVNLPNWTWQAGLFFQLAYPAFWTLCGLNAYILYRRKKKQEKEENVHECAECGKDCPENDFLCKKCRKRNK